MVKITYKYLPEALTPYIRKVFLIEMKGGKKHRQKVTASPFTYFSFVPGKTPEPYVDNVFEPISQKLYFTGPYLDKEIYLDYSGRINHLCYELSAVGMYSLFHISPVQLIDKLINLKDLVPIKNYILLENELMKIKSIEKQKEIIDSFLIRTIESARHVDDYIFEALKIIEQHKGYIPVNKVVENVNIGERQFRRKFKEVVGLKPKTYCEVLNAHYIITFINQKNYKSIQDLAYNSDFYDLAHFCHRFKKLTGLKPTEFINSKETDFAKKIYSTELREN